MKILTNTTREDGYIVTRIKESDILAWVQGITFGKFNVIDKELFLDSLTNEINGYPIMDNICDISDTGKHGIEFYP